MKTINPVHHIHLSKKEINEVLIAHIKTTYKMPYRKYKLDGGINIDCYGDVNATFEFKEIS